MEGAAVPAGEAKAWSGHRGGHGRSWPILIITNCDVTVLYITD